MVGEKRGRSFFKMTALIVLFILYILPFALVLVNSFKTKMDAVKQPLSLVGEHGFILSNYAEAIQKLDFFRAFSNSLLITACSVALTILVAAMAAYYFARRRTRTSRTLFFGLIASVAVPFQVLMIPLVSIYGANLGILNHRPTLIFMHIGFSVSISIFLLRSAILQSVPRELEEAAEIDGCGKFGLFFRIVFPILRPTVATLVIINALAIWNDYLLPSLVLGRRELYTLPIAARVFYGTFSSDLGLMMAALVLTMIPILILYLFLQRYIMAGVVDGAVKG